MNNKKNLFLGTLLLNITAFLWGTSFIPQKYLITVGIPPFYMIAFRFSLISLLFFFIRRHRISRRTFLHGMFLGFLLFIAFSTQTYGLKNLDISVSAFLTSMSIVFIPIFNFFLFKKRITKFHILAIIVALIGAFMFNYKKDVIFAWSPSIILTLICSVAFTLHIIYSGVFIEKGESALNLHFFQCVFTALFSLIAGVFTETLPKNWTSTSIFAILYLGIVASILCYGLQIFGQKLIKSPLKAGLIISLEPAWAFVLSIFIFGEIITIPKMIGINFIALGIILCEWKPLLKVTHMISNKK